jgi:hypothetical protein
MFFKKQAENFDIEFSLNMQPKILVHLVAFKKYSSHDPVPLTEDDILEIL